MAVYYTDKSRSFATAGGVGLNGQEQCAIAIVAMTTAMLDNADDEVGLFYLPKGAIVTGATISATDMDTGAAALSIDVGDDDDEDRIFAAALVGQAATLSTALAVAGHLYKYTTRTLIKAYVKVAAATAAAGTLSVSVRYIVDPEFSTTALTATTTA